MKKLGIYLLYGGVLVFAIALIWMGVSSDKKTQSSESNTKNNYQKTEIQETKPAEKVQVYEFHSTNRCYSCITMGQYVKQTLEYKFSKELESGKIEFREINVDLPENKEVAKKFKAAGTALIINSIIDGQDNIKEEIQAWRLLSNEQEFVKYFSDKIRGIIGENISTDDKNEIAKKNVTFYTGENCSSCENIEKYFKENDIKNKVAFEEKNITKNEIDAQQMAEDAMQCEVDPESFGVPFLWADGKCYTNEKDIINFFSQK